MALLNFVLPQYCPSTFSHFNTYKINTGNNNVLAAGKLRLSSTTSTTTIVRKNLIRCEAVAVPNYVKDGGVVPGSTIVPADHPIIQRKDFPPDFQFGASSSALQTEGKADSGGRGPATWDYMISLGQEFPNLPASDDMATNSYEKYKEDVALLKNMGMDVYRFSISWSRILPNGSGDINQDGIDFYNNLIDELVANGIEPCVTLFHFDLPTALQTAYNGFLDRRIVDDFKNYADICFKYFGDRVKRWATINEPSVFSQYVYASELTIQDDPTTFPYIVAHNIILSHAAAATLYKQNYQATQGGEIGISVSTEWFEPYSVSLADKDAAARAFSFGVGWFLEPLVYGDYPFIMKAIVDDRLPSFTDKEKDMIKGAYDFIGINYYTSTYTQGLPISSNDVSTGYSYDQYLNTTMDRDGKPIGQPVNGNPNIYVVPDGLRDVLIYMKQNYSNPKIYITENGVSEPRNDELPLEQALDDEHRIIFINRHLNAVQEALREGVNVKGYFVWALLDCMEIGAVNTYTTRFGLNFTDYSTTELKRYPKKSAEWYSLFLKGTRKEEENLN
ncbi:Glycoside hydrolase [Macleaya cordata]|uniref:Glycoside hydrolase n=1 Tax=Macleaya cordata TaxID=56857 RepID=A0A200QMI4_MACCD|nr:Glycoside hydrolase [Macleaya cordata]